MINEKDQEYLKKQKKECAFSAVTSIVMIAFSCCLILLGLFKPNVVTSRIPIIVTLRAQLDKDYSAYEYLKSQAHDADDPAVVKEGITTELEGNLFHDYLHLLFAQWRTIDRFMCFIQLLFSLFLLLLSVFSLMQARRLNKILSVVNI